MSRLRARVSFQFSILKILAGQPAGQSIEIVKQHLAIYYTSGPEWPARMTRIASRAPDLNIFGQKLIEREVGYWTITQEGRRVLESLEQLDRDVAPGQKLPPLAEQPAAGERPSLPSAPSRSIAGRNRARRKRLRIGKDARRDSGPATYILDDRDAFR
ncbi:hypothetical protein [Bradyrhizobium sp. USDA 3315]